MDAQHDDKMKPDQEKVKKETTEDCDEHCNQLKRVRDSIEETGQNLLENYDKTVKDNKLMVANINKILKDEEELIEKLKLMQEATIRMLEENDDLQMKMEEGITTNYENLSTKSSINGFSVFLCFQFLAESSTDDMQQQQHQQKLQ